ncbi:MAG TPA: TIGR03618 family F420-dependent PPOX class oxidoreductase [Acidimicrobiales bacterium]|nr:TIGR03618 family F420-dependent PPOX class oxidoreductase [Acidimicrobiales bacterium]
MTALRAISAEAEVLLGSSALAHVVTRNRDGTPQVSVVWCGVQGDRVVFCADGQSAKVRNLRRDPNVILSVEDEARNIAGTQQHLLIHGTASVVGPADRAVCDELCRVYVGTADTPLNLSRSSTAVTVEVTVQRLAGNGPWAGALAGPTEEAAAPARSEASPPEQPAPAAAGKPSVDRPAAAPAGSSLGSSAGGLRGR